MEYLPNTLDDRRLDQIKGNDEPQNDNASQATFLQRDPHVIAEHLDHFRTEFSTK